MDYHQGVIGRCLIPKLQKKYNYVKYVSRNTFVQKIDRLRFIRVPHAISGKLKRVNNEIIEASYPEKDQAKNLNKEKSPRTAIHPPTVTLRDLLM